MNTVIDLRKSQRVRARRITIQRPEMFNDPLFRKVHSETAVDRPMDLSYFFKGMLAVAYLISFSALSILFLCKISDVM